MRPRLETEHVYPTLGVSSPVLNGPYRERLTRCRDCVSWDGWERKVCHEWSHPEDGIETMTPPEGFCFLGEPSN